MTTRKLLRSRRAAIRAARRRVESFERYMERIPEDKIELNLWFNKSIREVSKRDLKSLLNCGAVGCVGGWMVTSPAYRKFNDGSANDNRVVEFIGQDVYPTRFGDMFFTGRQDRTISQEEEAMGRIRKRIGELKKADTILSKKIAATYC